MDNNNKNTDELDSLLGLQSPSEETELENKISLLKHAIEPESESEKSPRTELERMIDGFPAEERAKFYKVVSQAGLRDDDYLWSLLYIMGYIKVMYEDIPASINNASAAMASQTKVIEPMIRAVVEKEVKKLKHEFTEQIERLISAQGDVSKIFKEGADDYMAAMKKAEDDIDEVISAKRTVILELTTKTLKKEFPVIANQYLSELVDESKKASSKNFLIVVSGVVVGGMVLSILTKIGQLLF